MHRNGGSDGQAAARAGQADPGQLDGRSRGRAKAGTFSASGNIPSYPYPDTAARAFATMWRYSDNLRSIYETPSPTMESVGYKANKPYVREIIENARQAGRTILTEFESKHVLAAYGIPVTVTSIARTEDEAVEHRRQAERPGRPEAPFGNHHAQDRRRRREAQSRRRSRPCAGLGAKSKKPSPKKPVRPTSSA